MKLNLSPEWSAQAVMAKEGHEVAAGYVAPWIPENDMPCGEFIYVCRDFYRCIDMLYAHADAGASINFGRQQSGINGSLVHFVVISQGTERFRGLRATVLFDPALRNIPVRWVDFARMQDRWASEKIS